MSNIDKCLLCGSKRNRVVEKHLTYSLYECEHCTFVWGKAIGNSADYDLEYNPDGLYVKKKYEAINVKKVKGFGPKLFFLKINPGKGKKLLDIGCGGGLFLSQANNRGYKVIGCDVSEKAIDFITKNLNLEAYPMDIKTLINVKPNLLNTFDYVTAFEVFEHLADPSEFLKSIKYLLKPNGKLFLSTPNWNSRYYRASQGKSNRPPFHITFWNPSTIKNICTQLGFKNIKVYQKPFAIGEFHKYQSKIKRASKIFKSFFVDGICRRSVGTTMVVEIQNAKK